MLTQFGNFDKIYLIKRDIIKIYTKKIYIHIYLIKWSKLHFCLNLQHEIQILMGP
jgi:hypothetical protein